MNMYLGAKGDITVSYTSLRVFAFSILGYMENKDDGEDHL